MPPTVGYLSISERHRRVTRCVAETYAHQDGVLFVGKARLREAYLLWAAANRLVETVLGPVSAEKLQSLADQVASQEFLDAYTARKKPRTNPEVTSE
jgi:hypothetical protein